MERGNRRQSPQPMFMSESSYNFPNQMDTQMIEKVGISGQDPKLSESLSNVSSATHSFRRRWNKLIQERRFNANIPAASLEKYEPLLDGYLQDYFSHSGIKKHLIKFGILDDQGHLVDFKTYKYKQIKMDRAEKEEQERQEKIMREMHREIEITIQNYSTNNSVPNKSDIKRTDTKALEKYPASLRKTAQLYTQKPSVFMKAEHLALERLYRQSPEKLRAMGLSKNEVKIKLDRAQQKMKDEEEKIQETKKAIKKSRIPIPESKPREKPVAPAVTEQQKRPKKVDMITELFEVAKMEYKTHQLEATERHLRELLDVITKKSQEEKPNDTTPTKAPFIPSGTHIISERELEKRAVSRPSTAETPKKKPGLLEPKSASRPTTARSSRPPSARPASAKPKKQTSPAFITYDEDDFEPVEELICTSAKDRPMTARPKRTSSYPKTEDFSDVESDYERAEGDKSLNASVIESQDILGSVYMPTKEEAPANGFTQTTSSITNTVTTQPVESTDATSNIIKRSTESVEKDSLPLLKIPSDIGPTRTSALPNTETDSSQAAEHHEKTTAVQELRSSESVCESRDAIKNEKEQTLYEGFTSTPDNTTVDQPTSENFTSTPHNTAVEQSKEKISDRVKQEKKSNISRPTSGKASRTLDAPRKPLTRTQSSLHHNFKQKESDVGKKKQTKSANSSMDKLDVKNKPIVLPKKAKQSPHQSIQKISREEKAQTPADACTPREAAAKVFVSQLLRDTAQELQHESHSSHEQSPTSTDQKIQTTPLHGTQIVSNESLRSALKSPSNSNHSLTSPKNVQWQDEANAKASHSELSTQTKEPMLPQKAIEETGSQIV